MTALTGQICAAGWWLVREGRQEGLVRRVDAESRKGGLTGRVGWNASLEELAGRVSLVSWHRRRGLVVRTSRESRHS